MAGGKERKPTDSLIAWALGAAVALLAWFSGNSSEVPPELWDEIAVAAKLRLPAKEFPLLWQNVLSHFIAGYGLEQPLEWLRFLGPVSLGLLAAMSYRLLYALLPVPAEGLMRRTASGRWMARMIAAQGVLLFVCSQPVWLSSRVFSPEMAKLLLMVGSLLCVCLTVRKSSLFCIVLVGALSGILAAETLLALLPPVLCACWLYRGYDDAMEDAPGAMANPIVLTLAVRRMIGVFVVFYLAALSFNLSFFLGNGAGGQPDVGVFVASVKYLLNYLTAIKSSATLLGYLMLAAVVVLPMVIVAAKVRTLTDDEKRLPLPYAFFAALVLVVTVLQSTTFHGCRFWDWVPDAIASDYLLCLSALASSIIAVHVFCIFAVDLFCRDHERLISEEFPGALEGDESVAAKVLRSLHRTICVMRIPARFAPLVILALLLPFKFDSSVQEMSAIVNGIARQTAAESAGSRMIFTDGSYDAAVEVAAAKNGWNLKALSMIAGGGGYEAALRKRGETNEEYRAMLEVGAADALRMWVRDNHECVSNIAVQVGIELWHHAGMSMPEAGGLVFRTDGFPEGEAEKWGRNARAIAERIVEFCMTHDLQECGYSRLRKLFYHGQWRLSRMCRMRANRAEVRKDAEASGREYALADKLDKCNVKWQALRDKVNWIARQGGVRLTPREGLKLGLERADFRMARTFAERILSLDADDTQANFAMGMSCLMEKRYSLAEKYLKKCLLRSPNEPAVLNNLAVAQLRLNRLDEAQTNALKALELYPASAEIKETLRHIGMKKTEGTETK